MRRVRDLLDRQSVRYVISGGISYVCEFGFFLIFYYVFGLASGLANACSLILAWSVNFTLSHLFVFRGHGVQLKRSLPKYLTLAGFNLLLSSIIIQVAVSEIGIKAYIAKPIVSAAFIAWTFFIYRKFVFRGSQLPPELP